MRLCWLIISLTLLAACNQSDSDMTNKTPPIEITLNSPIQEAIDSNSNSFSKECLTDQELCWYKSDKSANDKNLSDVVIKHAKTTLNIEKATNITIVIDESVGENIENIDITLRGLPDNSTHEQNRAFISALITKIKDAGWSHFFMAEDPRISGSQADKINTPYKVLGRYVGSHPWLDPDYQPNPERWLQIGPFYNWYFYNNGAYLHLKAWRQNDEEAPSEKATYLMTLEFQSERDFWLDGITDEKERAQWKELLPKRLDIYHAARLALEEKARAAGIEIDETYQDPPIHVLNK